MTRRLLKHAHTALWIAAYTAAIYILSVIGADVLAAYTPPTAGVIELQRTVTAYTPNNQPIQLPAGTLIPLCRGVHGTHGAVVSLDTSIRPVMIIAPPTCAAVFADGME